MKTLCVFLIIGASMVHAASKKLTIGTFEALGFTKTQQQLFTMIGAEDGWAGTFDGEVLEIYQYRDAATLDQFKLTLVNSVAPGNASGWVDHCIHHNIVVISKGFSACDALKQLC